MAVHETNTDSHGVAAPDVRFKSRRVWWPDVVLALLAGAVSVLVAGWAMGIRPRDLGIPWGEGDLLPSYSFAENILRGHWFLTNPDLGFPGFQDQGHFPITDLVSIAQIALLSVLTSSPVLAVNLFTLGTFFTVAAVFYLVLRYESVSRWLAVVIAVAFAVLPWHFARSAGGHIFLASYVSVPLALFLVGLIARRRFQRPRRRWLLPAAIASAIFVGANGVYYALMTTVLMCVVLLITSLRPRVGWPAWRAVLVTALVPATTLGAVLLNIASISTPSTGESVVRDPSEAYLYGGNLATLFFPSMTTRSGHFLSRFLDLGFPNNGTFETDAMLSSAGVLAVLLTCGIAALRWSTLSAIDPRSAVGRAAFWPGLFLLTTAFSAVGGLGALFSFWISNDIRAWGRFFVFVVGIAFLVTGIVLTVWSQSKRLALRICSMVLGILLAVSAVVDLSGGGQRLPLQQGRALDAELRTYVAAVEKHTNLDCAVLELPLVPYPEYPAINRMFDYSHLWSYVYSHDLRWSYGAMKGTPLGDWGMDVRDNPKGLLARAREAGFCGIQVDTWAFANLADAVGEQEAFGNPDIVSSSGRWAFFDLTGPRPGEYSAAPDAGFTVAVNTVSLPVTWWMVDDTGTVRVQGRPGDEVQVDLEVSSPPCGPIAVSIGGSSVTVKGSQQHIVSVKLDGKGTGSIPIVTHSAPCTISGEAAPVRLGLEGPHWTATATNSER